MDKNETKESSTAEEKSSRRRSRECNSMKLGRVEGVNGRPVECYCGRCGPGEMKGWLKGAMSCTYMDTWMSTVCSVMRRRENSLNWIHPCEVALERGRLSTSAVKRISCG